MTNFDLRLPDTTTYWKDGDIFFIKHTNFLISMEEAYAIGEMLKHFAAISTNQLGPSCKHK
ncbi:hypothetical protein PSTEL_17835 [Paenibacillus stellifer]|uniref:Uncharacterized protein n=1 Tax=Paenibacillus stellifer TaxID=169760 RepID=A0A089LX19_9BACL|nr:hypothetical protein [Paenibacillus stellifer]AIQ64690.1 hypothetical protein PSTEL_17835 [Paenibacillus stellifer]